MFSGVSFRSHDSANFFACITRIKVIEQIAERGKLIIAFVAVYTVVDCDIANITLREEALCIVADFQIVTPHARHILDDNRRDFSGFRKAYHFIPTGAVKSHTRNAVVNEKYGI